MKVIRVILDIFGIGKTKIRRQMYIVYICALLIPLLILGTVLATSMYKMLNDRYTEELQLNNTRVRNMLSEVTTAVYNISKEIIADQPLRDLVNKDYSNGAQFMVAANGYTKLDELLYNEAEINRVFIYTDNPTIRDHKQFVQVTDEIAETDWYQRAIASPQPFWTVLPSAGTHEYDNLVLVRSIASTDMKYHIVVTIRVKDTYVRNRVAHGEVVDAISLGNQGIVYSSQVAWYQQEAFWEVDYEDPYYSFSGKMEVDDKDYFVSVSTCSLYMTNDKLYICTMDGNGVNDIRDIMMTWVLILVLSICIPGMVLMAFANYFSARVYLLREEMHKARQQDYNIISKFSGNDELTEAFEDLKFMVQDIKDKEAKVYEAELNEKEIRNKQQVMEYKMLASQINPHYLYNTLETIRMKALTSGNRDVADSIKILGKTLHYVLENTGTAETTLKKELDHVENYLAIQKLRFGDRINYEFVIAPEVNTEEYSVLPLLLQPIVENAVIHGLEVIDGAGKVIIAVEQQEADLLWITVSDSGKGMTEEELEKIREMLKTPELHPQSSIALYNIQQRIRLYYGEEYGVEIYSEYGKGTQVVMKLPAFLP
ncbi:MAG: histidine kinase [Agathobacter sp.]